MLPMMCSVLCMDFRACVLIMSFAKRTFSHNSLCALSLLAEFGEHYLCEHFSKLVTTLVESLFSAYSM